MPNPPPELQAPRWIDTAEALKAVCQALAGEPRLAVDTESNSLYAYRERICLIQVSSPAVDYVIDPLALADLAPVGKLLADPAIEIVFHACEYDIICLARDYGFRVTNAFDTMVAARTLGWPNMGLAKILEDQWGVQTNKRFQRADWSRRPLSSEQLRYACLDTHYLLPLRDKLYGELEARGQWEEAREEFERLARTNGVHATFDPEGFWRITGARDLAPREAAVLRELYHYRDRAARRADRPPFKVFGDTTLLAIARRAPKAESDLNGLPGMTEAQISRHGPGLLAAVERGHSTPAPRPPHGGRLDEEAHDRYEALRTWRKRRAQERGVESDVIMPREALWAIAQRNPRSADDLAGIAELGPWRREKYGGEIIKLLAGR